MRLTEVGSQYIITLVDSKGEYQTRSMLQPPLALFQGGQPERSDSGRECGWFDERERNRVGAVSSKRKRLWPSRYASGLLSSNSRAMATARAR
jgi:hypothetical protein